MEKKKVVKKEKKPPRLYWNELVEVFFNFYLGEFGENPTFGGSSPRDLGEIIDCLQKKSEEKNVEWTEQMAKSMLLTFLQFANKRRWLHENFLLFNLNRQKDVIIIDIKNYIHGKSKPNSKEQFREDVSNILSERNYEGRED